jgi:anti-anti-sigma factor
MADTAEIFHAAYAEVGDWTVLTLTGELDIAGVPALREAISQICAAHAEPRVLVDLSHVDFMDSGGLSGLVKAWKRVTEPGGRFVLAGVRPRVRRVLEITRMTDAFEMCDDAGSVLGG